MTIQGLVGPPLLLLDVSFRVVVRDERGHVDSLLFLTVETPLRVDQGAFYVRERKVEELEYACQLIAHVTLQFFIEHDVDGTIQA